jgi:hypothetical protein
VLTTPGEAPKWQAANQQNLNHRKRSQDYAGANSGGSGHNS